MNAIVTQAIAALHKLPEAEQEAIARELLERIEADTRWDRLFADPRSEALLSRLAAEANEEIMRGEVFDYDPSSKPNALQARSTVRTDLLCSHRS